MWKSFLFNAAFAVNCLLAFLLAFESGLSIPPWLQVFGRIHPLFLHIPIGLLLLYAITELFFSFRNFQESITDLKDGLLLISLVSISLTALMGLFLSRESGYEPEAVFFHKWIGTLVCFLILAWYQWRKTIRSHPLLNKMIALLSIVFITVTGHMGGNITHGENFVLAPVLPKEEDNLKVPFEEAVVFRNMVQPILKEKCISCHNERKAKGELVMETTELLLKGGKNGKLWDTAANDLGLLLKRVNLPLDHDDHMPPKGKVQLTDTEKTILEAWIRSGSNLTMKVVELPANDTLKVLATAMFSSGEEEAYAFEEAGQSAIESLNNYYRIVKPLAENSPALIVNFYGRNQFAPQQISDLKPVSAQIVEMDFSRMPLKDEQLTDIAGFPNLRKLILNFTDIKGSGLAALQKLQHLKELSLSGTDISPSSLDVLQSFPSLKKVYLWNIPSLAGEPALAQFKKGKIKFESGFNGDTLLLKLTPPIFDNESVVLSGPSELKLKHNINGAEIRYTLDGSDPDSVRSLVFNNNVRIDKDVIVKAKAFRNGWISSDISSSPFYISAIKPKKVRLLTSPNEKYMGSKERTLFDYTLGGTDLGSGKWLAYESPSVMDVMIELDTSSKASSVMLSCYQSMGRLAFIPQSISVWYGNDSLNLKKLENRQMPAPVKDNAKERTNKSFVFNFPKGSFRYIRLQVTPLMRTPQWHKEKGERAWIFVDEIAIN